MTGPNENNVTLEGVRIVFRNFSGNETQYNAAGKRNFNVVLDEAMANLLESDGWNVKRKPPKEEGDDPFNVLHVTVSYKGRPPRVIMISSRGRTTLDEETVDLLDFADIENVDMIIRPYDWEVNGNTGRKAYLHAIYVTIHEDELELKYADVHEIKHYDEVEAAVEEEFE
jgi:hypothetical protein